jgi:hypothetical protein
MPFKVRFLALAEQISLVDRDHRHVKCDGTMPTCKRCATENKPCFYVKSRRGIRDRRERSLISDKPPARPVDTSHLQISTNVLRNGLSNYSGGTFGGGLGYGASASPPNTEDTFLVAYYTHFHPSHSVMLPKHHFIRYMDVDPDSVTFLLAVVRFIGSHYASSPSSEELRDSAFAGACGPLPMTPQSVLGLLLLSIAALGEMKIDYQNGWSSRAISMALEIGMQHKSFADSARDPILAECHRRVYWGLYLVDCMRAARDPSEGFSLNDDTGHVDLPCEEWEYSAGVSYLHRPCFPSCRRWRNRQFLVVILLNLQLD